MRFNSENYLEARRSFGGPAWRSAAALEAAKELPRRDHLGDPLIDDGAAYHRLSAASPQGAEFARRKFAAIAEAIGVWDNTARREPIQMLTLAGCGLAEIASRVELRESIVRTTQDLFFDVRGRLDALVWITTAVIGAEADAGRDDQAARMRVAYFGGPSAARALLDAKGGLPVTRAEQLASATMLLGAKLIEAANKPFSEQQSVEVMRFMAEIQVKEKKLALEREKLMFAIRRWEEKHGQCPPIGENDSQDDEPASPRAAGGSQCAA